MKVYTTDRIRNVVILGHGGSGKTSLVEAMAYLSGVTSRMGSISEGNTVSDYDKEEIKRKFSINTTVMPIIWGDIKVNVLDTPGYFDFVGEAEEAAAAADAAVIVINGKNGVEVGTQKAWELCEKYKLPRMFFVSNMDVDNASFRQVVEDLTELYGKKIAPIHLPIRENEKFVGYVNVVRQEGRRWLEKGEKEPCDIPDYSMEYLEKYRENLLEAVAETSEEFMDRYFAGETFSPAEIMAALTMNVDECSIVPVAMGSPVNFQGVINLLDDIVQYFPSPDKRTIAGINMKTSEIYEANYDFAKAKSAFVFKTIVDPFIGKYSLVKVASGVIKNDDLLYNVNRDEEVKLNKLYVMEGSKPIEVPELHAGDIGAIGKLNVTRTGDTLATKNTPIQYAGVDTSTPYTYKRYFAKNKGEEDKVAQALAKMMLEDLTMKAVNDAENRQTLIYGMGDQHIDIIASKLLSKYKVEIELARPKVAFRETIRKNSDVEAKYKKQSGGHGQYGHVKMRFANSGDMETPYVFEQVVVGGAVPKNYFPAVEKGIQESVQRGPLAAYPVVGVKATLYDGSYHPVDSSEMAFKTAAIQAFKKGFMEASPVLLEPIASLKVTVPDKFTGDVMGDLNKRRGRVLGMNPDHKGNQIIEADIPMMELYGYSTQLRSMTGGSGNFAYEFARYEQAPSDIQAKEVEARASKVKSMEE
ncbi:Elongation factor G [uncultured Clostridium sp.]|uniref:Elongation factor G n=1 Tax=Muricoprocola aceti TaxID=2981772 RepID=A0ABT2SI53_9FIRM|nr:elongation factor G [Muricoprocola aceti]MCI7227564.1 elongation factor G [Lachnospiraceae bacterium]MCQ4772535.1 elongation factor G [Lacrimispora saccharolytica]SCH01316.1 Elongation factor G [uncultured Clostridium sp.]MCU6724165.1 elongation factor G [Muricoprocola aceti]MDD7435753.1 elongation factor G [Lachnospiraceae bacterium]